jgi:hypothetical protein
MKELLTKKFWRDVKKTFEEARAETTPKSGDSQAASPLDAKPSAGKPAEIPAPPPEAVRPAD